MFKKFINFDEQLNKACEVTAKDIFKVNAGETALIVTNDVEDVYVIALCLYDHLENMGVRPVLMVQPLKTVLDMAEDSVSMAMRADADIIISLSAEKLGKDRYTLADPYSVGGKTITSHFNYLMETQKSRSFWAPGVTLSIFRKAVAIDYPRLKREATAVKAVLDRAERVHVQSAAGTDIMLSVEGRSAYSDDGDFSTPGSGGNLPAGETYVSPAVGSCEGTLVFDGSVAVYNGTLLIGNDTPVTVKVEKGYVTGVTGGKAAEALLKTIEDGEALAMKWEAEGKLPFGQGAVYQRNARHIGELGIGLNPAATLTGNMLIDEKAYQTCHFAIGSNYDDDAPSLIHQDCVCKNPTITAVMPDGQHIVILENGLLKL
jgi:aminopeptidase